MVTDRFGPLQRAPIGLNGNAATTKQTEGVEGRIWKDAIRYDKVGRQTETNFSFEEETFKLSSSRAHSHRE